jgi:hypothetical protein
MGYNVSGYVPAHAAHALYMPPLKRASLKGVYLKIGD